MELSAIPISPESWPATVRLVSSRYPPVGIFDRVADAKDLDALYYIEGLTNPRIRSELGEITLVDQGDRLSGPGTSPIMAAFTHVNPYGSRFSDGKYGVYYCARAIETAIHETVFHRERFLRDGSVGPIMLEMRVYYADIVRSLHDLRDARISNPEIYNLDDYSASRQLGVQLKAARSYGALYQSVRHDGGECAAVFRPPALSPVRQGEHYGYMWNGHRIERVISLRTVI